MTEPVLRHILGDLLDKPYRLAMGLKALDLDDWLIVTSDHAAEIAEKRRLLEAGADIRRLLPEGGAAAAETAELVATHLARHPSPARMSPEIADPLTRAGLAVQEDLCLMAPSPEGYRLVGAFLAFPSRWSLAEKLGRPMREIHAPVPGLEGAIGGPIGVFFSRLTVDRPVWRANWSLLDDPTLHQPSGSFRRARIEPTADNAGQSFWLRVERQTLRRLPRTGMVLFTILTLVEPLERLAQDPNLAGLLADRLDELPEPMLAYKGLAGRRPALAAWLRLASAGPAGRTT